jgi:regulator of sigma E protease
MYQIMRYGYTGEPVAVKVRHADGTRETLSIVFPVEEIEGQRFGSFDFTVLPEERSFGSVLRHVFFRSCYIVEMIWESIIDLFTGRYTIDAVAGPIGTAGAITEAAKTGFNSLLYITIVITINLGVFNLLPIPPLDGGHIVYTLYEMVFRRPVPQKVSALLDSAFTLLFFGFLIFITIKDLVGFF